MIVAIKKLDEHNSGSSVLVMYMKNITINQIIYHQANHL